MKPEFTLKRNNDGTFSVFDPTDDFVAMFVSRGQAVEFILRILGGRVYAE